MMIFVLVLSLHCATATTLTAGTQCGGLGSTTGTCADGLVCLPETPGSVISVCRVAEGCQRFGCNLEHNECVCRTAASCTIPTQYNFTSLEECQEFIKVFAVCELEGCPRVWCGPNLQYTLEGECCPSCPPLPSIIYPTLTTSPGCTENDEHYNEGETWQRDACVMCTCEAGLPLCSSTQCVAPECDNPIVLPGQCCPTCPLSVPTVVFIPEKTECEYDGETHGDGESWNHNGDPCTTCFCEGGEVLCASQHCLVECENAIQLPDTCCPICPEDSGTETSTWLPVPVATTLPPPPPPTVPFHAVITTPITHCEYDGQIYDDGASWNPHSDPCTTCSCDRGFNLCTARSCWVGCKEPVFLSGLCCPVCPGDEHYPSSEPATTATPLPSHTTRPTLPTTQPLSEALVSSTATNSLSPTPLPADITSSTTCKDSSGVEQTNGASWCPTPFVRATCLLGDISYTKHHCPTPTCQNSTWAPGSCSCPVCPHDVETVSISAVLELSYSQYLKEQESVRRHLEAALTDLGLEVLRFESAEFGREQTHVVISVSPSNDDQTLLDLETLQTLLDQLKSPLVSSVMVGHYEDSKSITGISNAKVQQSPQRHSHRPGRTTIIIAATASVAIAVISATILAVIITRAWRKRDISKTVTVTV